MCCEAIGPMVGAPNAEITSLFMGVLEDKQSQGFRTESRHASQNVRQSIPCVRQNKHAR